MSTCSDRTARSVTGAGRGRVSNSAAFYLVADENRSKSAMRKWWFVKLFQRWFMVIRLNQMLKKTDMLFCLFEWSMLLFTFLLCWGGIWISQCPQKNRIAVEYRTCLIQNPSPLPAFHLVTTEPYWRWISLQTQLTWARGLFIHSF